VTDVADIAGDVSTVAAMQANIAAILAAMAPIVAVYTNLAAVVATGTNIASVNTVAANMANILLAVADIPALAAKLNITGSNIGANGPAFRLAVGLDYADLPFLSVPVGGLLILPTHIAGVTEPAPGSALYRFAKLTAGLTGVGAYNNGILTSESTTGSAPLVLSTATVSLAGSPINGQSIRLLNTEGRFVRPGTTSGTVRNDALQDHIHQQTGRSSGAGSDWGATNASGTAGINYTQPVYTAGGVRVDTSTYPKHIEMTHYMRIK
jgi:hypothetical protein